VIEITHHLRRAPLQKRLWKKCEPFTAEAEGLGHGHSIRLKKQFIFIPEKKMRKIIASMKKFGAGTLILLVTGVSAVFLIQDWCSFQALHAISTVTDSSVKYERNDSGVSCKEDGAE